MIAALLQAARLPKPAAPPIRWGQIVRDLLDPEFLLRGLIHVLVVVGIAYLAFRVVKASVARIARREIAEEDPLVKRQRTQRIQTMAGLANNVAGAVIFTLAALTVLSDLGFPIASLLASVGVVGLAISFGAQSLVKDVITGAFILMEGQFGIGDVVTVDQVSGLVEKVTLRTTVLRDVYGTVHTIPNGQITRVSNLTKSWSRAVVDVSIAYKEDVDRVVAVLRDLVTGFAADPAWQPLLLGDPEVPGIQNLGDSGVGLRVMVKTLPLKQWEVAAELRRRIKLRFDREGIEIPFPTITFYWGDGQMPSALPGAPSSPGGGSTEPGR